MHHSIENANYFMDARNRKPLDTTLYLDDDSEYEMPTKWGVCDVCHGEGKHVNPSIDAGGISPDTFADDPEFYDNYMNGLYDVQCNACEGRTTVKVVDLESCSKDIVEQWEAQLEAEHQHYLEQLAEIRAGC